jgi:hypothetical protein
MLNHKDHEEHKEHNERLCGLCALRGSVFCVVGGSSMNHKDHEEHKDPNDGFVVFVRFVVPSFRFVVRD